MIESADQKIFLSQAQPLIVKVIRVMQRDATSKAFVEGRTHKFILQRSNIKYVM